jgi:hypothetical protein
LKEKAGPKTLVQVHHLYADDMQAIASGPLSCALVINSSLEICLKGVGSWCASKRHQLNASKTEVMWFGTAAMLRKIPSDYLDIMLNEISVASQ